MAAGCKITAGEKIVWLCMYNAVKKDNFSPAQNMQ